MSVLHARKRIVIRRYDGCLAKSATRSYVLVGEAKFKTRIVCPWTSASEQRSAAPTNKRAFSYNLTLGKTLTGTVSPTNSPSSVVLDVGLDD